MFPSYGSRERRAIGKENDTPPQLNCKHFHKERSKHCLWIHELLTCHRGTQSYRTCLERCFPLDPVERQWLLIWEQNQWLWLSQHRDCTQHAAGSRNFSWSCRHKAVLSLKCKWSDNLDSWPPAHSHTVKSFYTHVKANSSKSSKK